MYNNNTCSNNLACNGIVDKYQIDRWFTVIENLKESLEIENIQQLMYHQWTNVYSHKGSFKLLTREKYWKKWFLQK